MNYNIRPMTKNDWSFVSEIYTQGIRSNLATFHSSCPSYEVWDAAHLSECRYVIEQAGEVVGFTALSPASSQHFYSGVAEVCIYLADHTQKQGLGQALLNHLIAQSEEHQIWTLESLIMENNPASLRLHEKCGFRTVGTREKFGCDIHGSWRNVVLMERRSTLPRYH